MRPTGFIRVRRYARYEIEPVGRELFATRGSNGITADTATFQHLNLDYACADGEVGACGATITGELTLPYASCAMPARCAGPLDGATINGSLVAEELWADGPSSGKVR